MTISTYNFCKISVNMIVTIKDFRLCELARFQNFKRFMYQMTIYSMYAYSCRINALEVSSVSIKDTKIQYC